MRRRVRGCRPCGSRSGHCRRAVGRPNGRPISTAKPSSSSRASSRPPPRNWPAASSSHRSSTSLHRHTQGWSWRRELEEWERAVLHSAPFSFFFSPPPLFSSGGLARANLPLPLSCLISVWMTGPALMSTRVIVTGHDASPRFSSSTL